MLRYLRLFWVQLRASLATAMQYRVDFFVDGLTSVLGVVWTLVPLLVVFGARAEVAGWTREEALVVGAFFIFMVGVLDGAVTPSLLTIAEQIRTGTLDFVLIKPADPQFLVSTAKFAPFRAFDMVAGVVVAGVAFARMGRTPEALHVLSALALLAGAILIVYSIWILVVSASFWVVRLDNLSYLLESIFDAARWPVDVFRGVWRILFTFVIPLALMTTFPARALLGTLDGQAVALTLGGAVVFAALARAVWRRAIGRYTSASS